MTAPQAWFIGWDVGAWNCEKNANSRDALVVINQQGELVGKPWRGNLRDTIAAAASYTHWLHTVAKLCQFDDETKAVFATQNVVMAIDTPLGFSKGLLQLLQGEAVATPFTASSDNPYLYRHTERELFAHGFSPLSAIKDMIGSQATKGLHLLRKFGFTPSPSGIWQLNQNQYLHRALESYPTVLKPPPWSHNISSNWAAKPTSATGTKTFKTPPTAPSPHCFTSNKPTAWLPQTKTLPPKAGSTYPKSV